MSCKLHMVNGRLGHSSVAFTPDIYSHVLPGIQEIAAERFDQLIVPERVGVQDADILPTCCKKHIGTRWNR
ncbi:hypothetical protein ACFLU9_02015 [Chloroflexota bacterium]